MIEHLEHPELQVGVPVEKFSGDARWNGIIVSRYRTLSGKLRFAVEVLPQGFQMITTGPLLRVTEDYGLTWVPRFFGKWQDAYRADEPSPRKGYTVQQGDTLKGIALTFYNRADMWPLIAHANGMKPGEDTVVTGQSLWIPSRAGKRRNLP